MVKNIIFTLSFIFCNLICLAQNNHCEGRIIEEVVDNFDLDSICIDEVIIFETIRKYDSADIDFEKLILKNPNTFYISDSIRLLKNLQAIRLDIKYNYVVFPKGINEIKLIDQIINISQLSNETYRYVKQIDSLEDLYLGILTNKLTKIPAIAFSPKIKYISIVYKGENFKFLKKFMNEMLQKESLGEIDINLLNYTYTEKEMKFIDEIYKKFEAKKIIND